MAISDTPKNLWSEIEHAETTRDNHLGVYDEMIEKYAGQGYRDDFTQSPWSENHPYEFIRMTAARLIENNPRVRIKPLWPHDDTMMEGLSAALNRWCSRVNLRSTLRTLYADFCFAWGVTITTNRKHRQYDPRWPRGIYWPVVKHMSPKRAFWDPLACHLDEARYVGHKRVIDKDDLVKSAREKGEEAGWLPDVCEKCITGNAADRLGESNTKREDIGREECVIYQLWIPEIDTSDEFGFNGSIYTIGITDTGPRFIRKPQPFFGHPSGPYQIYGCYPVPGDAYPLAPFVATYRQMREANLVASATNRAMVRYKRLLLVSADNPGLAETVRTSRDALVVPIKGLQKDQVIEQEVGGITPQHSVQMQYVMDRLDRMTGISNVHRGDTGGGETATAISVADSAANASIAFVKHQFVDATAMNMTKVAWLATNDDRFIMPLGDEAPEIINVETMQPMGQPTFRGGGKPMDLDTVSIELYSMERMNEALLRAQYMELIQLVIGAAPVIPQTPYIDWNLLFQKGADVTGDMDFGRVVNVEMATQLGAMMMQQQQMAAQQQPPQGERQTGKQGPTIASKNGSQQRAMGPGRMK